MAKRGAGSSDFNMAEEIRNLLNSNKNLTGRDVVAQLRQKFPKQPINEGSCQVAFANARKKMGISTVRKKRPVGSAAGKKAKRTWSTAPKSAPASTASSDAALPGIDHLLAAKQLLQNCGGDASLAAAAVKQVASLQMK